MELLIGQKKVEEQFHTLVKKFLAKNDDYKLDKFIGGMPITLERSDMSQLITKDPSGKLKYTVTQKVDGTRVLMYIGYDMSNGNSVKQRIITFIDRNMKIYTIRDSKRSILPYVNTREMLLDGELVFFDADGISYKELDTSKVKGISFMAFDILFGPEDISVDSDNNKNIGQSFSFTVPSTGELKTFPWKYINRYDILHKLIVPSKFNKNEPILTTALKDTNWFNIELKPIYFLDSLKTHQVLYNESSTGYLQRLLGTSRREFYTQVLQGMYGKQVNVYISKTLKLDGLIFTSEDTLYTIGTWNKFLNTQYKWKPVYKQTVDLQMKSVSQNGAKLFVSRAREIVPFQQNFKDIIIPKPDNFKDNSIGEFSIEQNGRFKFEEYRTDKNTPNALKTVVNVINSFKNPVNINDMYYFINLGPKSKESEIKKVLEYSSKTQLLQCLAKSGNIPVISEENFTKLTELISSSQNKDTELELRLGNIGRFFNPKINVDTLDNIKAKLKLWKYTQIDEKFVDVYSENKIRTRYLYSPDFKRYILSESIVKNRLANVDIKLSEIINFDVRFSLSTETKIKEYNIEGESYEKTRTSFKDLNGMFSIDLTSIQSGTFNDRTFTKDNTLPSFQVEIEILKNNINPNSIFKLLISLVS